MKEAQSIKQVLQAARWILDNVGWCKGSYAKTTEGAALYLAPQIDPNTVGNVNSACLSGAVRLVQANPLLKVEALTLLQNKISQLTDSGLVNWNDDINRTKEQVLNLLDEVIGEQK